MMGRFISARAARLDGERGMSLVEMMISLLILTMVLAAFFAVLPVVQQAFSRETERSSSNDQARLAVQEMDREIRSGNLLYDPSNENDPTHGIFPYMSLRVYTQSNADTRIPGTRCVQWRIYDDQLQRRAWSVDWQDPGGVVEGWKVIADGIVNNSVSPAVRAFQLDTDSSKGNRTMVITIWARSSTQAGANTPTKITESVTGRDTEYGYPLGTCALIPPY